MFDSSSLGVRACSFAGCASGCFSTIFLEKPFWGHAINIKRKGLIRWLESNFGIKMRPDASFYPKFYP